MLKKITFIALLFILCTNFRAFAGYDYYTHILGDGVIAMHSDSLSDEDFSYDKEQDFISVEDTVRFFQYWNATIGDHYYTTFRNDNGMANYGYKFEVSAFRIISDLIYDDLTPLFCYWNPAIDDHFYTTVRNDSGYANYGYTFEKKVGYVFKEKPNFINTIEIYQYMNETIGDHYYTTVRNDDGYANYGYSFEGLAFYAVESPSDDDFDDNQEQDVIPLEDTVRFFQYWNATIGDHYYTTFRSDNGMANYGYKFEVLAFRIISDLIYEGITPLFRYWNPIIGDHLYTTIRNDGGYANYGYAFEEMVGYVFKEKPNFINTIAVYRYWNQMIGDHYYTTDRDDNKYANYGYTFEELTFYAVQ